MLKELLQNLKQKVFDRINEKSIQRSVKNGNTSESSDSDSFNREASLQELEEKKAEVVAYIEQTKLERMNDKNDIIFEPMKRGLYRSEYGSYAEYKGITFSTFDAYEKYVELENEQEVILKSCKRKTDKDALKFEYEIMTQLESVEHSMYRVTQIRSQLEKVFHGARKQYEEWKQTLEERDAAEAEIEIEDVYFDNDLDIEDVDFDIVE